MLIFAVTDKSTTEHKAKILNLKPEDLKLLALSNLNLSELYKLKSFSNTNYVFEEHTYHNLTVIENPTNVNNSLSELAVITVEPSSNNNAICHDVVHDENPTDFVHLNK